MSTPLRVLILEDTEDDYMLLLRVLRKGGYEPLHERVDSEPAMRSALAKQEWDLVISDYSMPQFDAPQALEVLKAAEIDIPFIIVSGTIGEESAIAALKAGAHDFMLKGTMPRLIPAIEREMREAAVRRAARQAQVDLRESEARYRSMFENTQAAKFMLDPTTWRVLEANPAACEFFGYSHAELLTRTIHDISLPPFEHLIERLSKALEGTYLPFSAYVRQRSGERRNVEIFPNTIMLQGQRIVYCILNDVTEQKQAENELAALYNATSFLFKAETLVNLGHQIVQAVVHEFDQVDCGLMLVDRTENKMIRLARAGEYGVDAVSVLYLDGVGLVPEAVRTEKIVYAPDTTADPHYAANDSRTRSELVIPLKTSKSVLGVLDLQSAELNAFNQRDLRILTAFAERAAAAIEVVQLYEEINRYAASLEQRVQERTAELERSKDHVEAILNNTSDAIILASYDGIIRQVNPAFSRIVGYNSDEIFSTSLFTIVPEDSANLMYETLHTVINTKLARRIEIPVQRKDGQRFDADVAFAPITEDDQIRDIVCSLRDITERKQIEEGLRRALENEKELNELKTRFVSMVSHDFRTPLAIIQSSTDALQQFHEKMDPEQRNKRLVKIRGQIQRMISLLNDVLTISRADAGATPFLPVITNLQQFCESIVDEFRQTPNLNHDIDYRYADQPVEAYIDEKLLHQAVTNLMTNAIKYSPEGTTIKFQLEMNDKTALIKVRDAGIGIPPEDQKHMFEPFHRAGNVGTIEGTGLGLAIVKRAVDSHGGSVYLESEVGKGTQFTIELPLQQTAN
ncbi:MAG: PAS domain S-box protein [Anaerolineae bacterium]